MLNESDVDSSVRKFNRVDLSFVALLLVFGSIVYGGRLTDLTIRGEESRRALVAVEILRTGYRVVPPLQEELYFSRPPLQNWLIEIGGQIRGQVDVWATESVLDLTRRERRQAMIVLNRVKAGTRVMTEVTAAVDELDAIRAVTALGNRVVYSETFGHGKSALEGRRGAWTDEILALVAEVQTTVGDS